MIIVRIFIKEEIIEKSKEHRKDFIIVDGFKVLKDEVKEAIIEKLQNYK